MAPIWVETRSVVDFACRVWLLDFFIPPSLLKGYLLVILYWKENAQLKM